MSSNPNDVVSLTVPTDSDFTSDVDDCLHDDYWSNGSMEIDQDDEKSPTKDFHHTSSFPYSSSTTPTVSFFITYQTDQSNN